MNVIEFLASISELYDLKMKPVQESYGLTAMELSLLLFLANNPKYDTAAEIVEIRHLTKSHVSTSIRSLEEKGYLKREYRGRDRRTIHLVLLPASRKAITAGQKSQSEYSALLIEHFSEDEVRQLKTLVGRINENVLKALEVE